MTWCEAPRFRHWLAPLGIALGLHSLPVALLGQAEPRGRAPASPASPRPEPAPSALWVDGEVDVEAGSAPWAPAAGTAASAPRGDRVAAARVRLRNGARAPAAPRRGAHAAPAPAADAPVAPASAARASRVEGPLPPRAGTAGGDRSGVEHAAAWGSGEGEGAGQRQHGSPGARPGAAPAHLLGPDNPCGDLFPYAARSDRGEVAVALRVAESGRPLDSQIVAEAPRGQGFAAAARHCVQRLHFAPALDGSGHAVASRSVVRLQFARRADAAQRTL